MNTHKKQIKNSSFLTLFTLFVAAVVVGISGWYAIDQYRLTNLQNQLQDRVLTKRETLKEQSGGLEFQQFINTSQALERAENYRITWSEVVRDILQFESPNIVFEQFSATPEKDIQISGVARSMSDIIQLLETLKTNQPNIKDVFLSQFSENQDAGQNNYTFELTFQFYDL